MNFTNNKLHFLKEYFLLKFIKSFPIDSKPQSKIHSKIHVWGVNSILGRGPKDLKAHIRKDGLDHLYESQREVSPLPQDNFQGVLDMAPTLKLSFKVINTSNLGEYK